MPGKTRHGPRPLAILASKMAGMHVGRPDGRSPFRFFLTFTEVGGLARVAASGREVHAMADGYEVAGILHAIPSALVPDDRDKQALVRVICLLNRLARTGEENGSGS